MFNFPKAERPTSGQYSSNFLKSVIFQVKFSKKIDIIDNDVFIDSLLIAEFPKKNSINQSQITLKIDKTPILVSSDTPGKVGLEYKSADDKYVYALTPDAFSLTIIDNAYTNFETEFEKYYKKLNIFCSKYDLESFTRIAIRKINVFEFNVPDEPPINALNHIFNTSVVSNMHSFPDSASIDVGITRVNFINDDIRLNISFGLNQRSQIVVNPSQRVASLDLDVFKIGNYDLLDFKSHMNEINELIFNVFSYMISDNIKAIMSGD